MLRKEVREKVKSRNLHNICVHTFHSLMVYHYHKDAHKDIVLRKILQTNMRPVRPIPRYDLVFLDESQDMSLLYYSIMVKFLMDMGNPIQICILGDYKQGIYQFRGSDIRFLTKAAQIWRKFPLLSFRFPPLFTNHVLSDYNSNGGFRQRCYARQQTIDGV